MAHIVHHHPQLQRRSFVDLIVRRVLLPIVFVVGLYGLVHYALKGKNGGMAPGYPEQLAKPTP